MLLTKHTQPASSVHFSAQSDWKNVDWEDISIKYFDASDIQDFRGNGEPQVDFFTSLSGNSINDKVTYVEIGNTGLQNFIDAFSNSSVWEIEKIALNDTKTLYKILSKPFEKM